MADVVVNLETNNPEVLVNQGIKAYNIGDFNSAVGALSQAVELLAAAHGDKHDSLGNAYLFYGKALLDVYREEVQPLGDAVPRELDSDSDDNTPAENSAQEGSDAKETIPTNKKTEAEKPLQEEPTSSESGDTKIDDVKITNGKAKAECSSSSDINNPLTEEETIEEDPSDLQVAWEVLELAKMIFEQRGEGGKKELAESLVLLGEVSLESENFASAIDDITHGLEIQKAIVDINNRTLAETYYKLAIALSTNNQTDEAVEQFNISLDILKNKINQLKENEEANKEEINDIESLIPEIEEKISDMKSYKEEAATHLMAAIQAKPESNSSFDLPTTTSNITANDISHLIKRKRKSDEGNGEEKPPKMTSK